MGYFWEELTDMSDVVPASQEMSKKYRDTLLGIKKTGEKEIFYGFLTNAYADNYIFQGSKTTLKVSAMDETVEVFVPKVPTGCYTSVRQKGLCVLSYLPHRQWKKGLCKQNTDITNVFNYYSKFGVPENIFNKVIMDIVENQGLQQQRTLDEVFTFLDKNNQFTSVHINRDFGLSTNLTDMDENKYYLFHERYLIGYVLRKEQKIVVENIIFMQEVIDSQSSWCPNYKVCTE